MSRAVRTIAAFLIDDFHLWFRLAVLRSVRRMERRADVSCVVLDT